MGDFRPRSLEHGSKTVSFHLVQERPSRQLDYNPCDINMAQSMQVRLYILIVMTISGTILLMSLTIDQGHGAFFEGCLKYLKARSNAGLNLRLSRFQIQQTDAKAYDK